MTTSHSVRDTREAAKATGHRFGIARGRPAPSRLGLWPFWPPPSAAGPRYSDASSARWQDHARPGPAGSAPGGSNMRSHRGARRRAEALARAHRHLSEDGARRTSSCGGPCDADRGSVECPPCDREQGLLQEGRARELSSPSSPCPETDELTHGDRRPASTSSPTRSSKRSADHAPTSSCNWPASWAFSSPKIGGRWRPSSRSTPPSPPPWTPRSSPRWPRAPAVRRRHPRGPPRHSTAPSAGGPPRRKGARQRRHGTTATSTSCPRCRRGSFLMAEALGASWRDADPDGLRLMAVLPPVTNLPFVPAENRLTELELATLLCGGCKPRHTICRHQRRFHVHQGGLLP